MLSQRETLLTAQSSGRHKALSQHKHAVSFALLVSHEHGVAPYSYMKEECHWGSAGTTTAPGLNKDICIS